MRAAVAIFVLHAVACGGTIDPTVSNDASPVDERRDASTDAAQVLDDGAAVSDASDANTAPLGTCAAPTGDPCSGPTFICCENGFAHECIEGSITWTPSTCADD